MCGPMTMIKGVIDSKSLTVNLGFLKRGWGAEGECGPILTCAGTTVCRPSFHLVVTNVFFFLHSWLELWKI